MSARLTLLFLLLLHLLVCHCHGFFVVQQQHQQPPFVTVPTTTTTTTTATTTKLSATTIMTENEQTTTSMAAETSSKDVTKTKPTPTEEEDYRTTSQSTSQSLLFPGERENMKFDCDPSVQFWREFQIDGPSKHTAQTNIQHMVEIAQRFLATSSSSSSSSSSSYFVRHLGRTGYFIVNALLGTTAFNIHEQFLNNNNGVNGNSDDADVDDGTPFSGIFTNLNSASATRLILEALICYEQDYDWIRRGVYNEPWDMSFGHRQSNPISVMTQTTRFIRESVGTLVRKRRASTKDKMVEFFLGGKDSSDTDGESGKSFVNDLYPKYYQNAFHYQTDGWMSSESANVYETSTETLFLGRQDSMQRTSLPPIMKLSKKLQQQNQGKEQQGQSSLRPMRVLEVACGTGRFMTFVRDNLPLDTEYTALDLSPFYLEKARDNDSYWRKQKQQQSESTKTISPATLVQGQAEQLPFDDESFDAVVCVYLFHEIPRDVRKQVVNEMARVTSPGGTVVFTDSIQKGDRPMLDEYLGNFEDFNEPYYQDYIVDDLSDYFVDAGLIPDTKIVRSTSKSLSFTKKEMEQ